MLHPDTELRFINDTIGYGVVAKKLIPKGTITWVQDDLDQVLTPEQADALLPQVREHLEKYSFTNSEGNYVLCWDNAKFVNHSFNPSCMSTAYDFEIALRDIHPGEQLTDDYGYLNVSEPFDAVDEGTHRKQVLPDDLQTYHAQWDSLIQERLSDIQNNTQPLLEFVRKETWAEFQKVMKGEAKLKSILSCYYNRRMTNDE